MFMNPVQPLQAAEKQARAQAIAKVLGTEPMTVREINAALQNA